MALIPTPEGSSAILNSIKGALGLFDDINKAGGVSETLNPMPVDEYESTYTEEKIVELIGLWKRTYDAYYDPIEKSQKKAFEYWVGKHQTDEQGATVDNLTFESIETFLPIATRANPDPVVTADPSDVGQEMAHAIKLALTNEADTQKLRRKLARMTRHWTIYRIGVAKVSWDTNTKSIKTDIINPKRMIFDKDGFIDEGGHFVGEYIGEKKRAVASKLIDMFPKKKQDILDKAGQKEGTLMEYFEWWYRGTDVFYTLQDTVLGKYKNPHWNYDGEEQVVDPITGEQSVTLTQGVNHLKVRVPPYVFLSIFSTGLQPHDETSLILQNIPIQDIINKRWRQIDKNVDGMNNGMIVSGTAFTEEQAAQAASALRRGVAIRVPNGKVQDAVEFPNRPGLPSDVYESLRDSRSELRNIFGTAGSSAEGTKSQDTVRGKILVNQMDSSRIGGGVTEQIEQVADSIYNLWVQFMFVYFDDEHFIIDSGFTGGPQLIALKNDKFPLLKTLNVTVKEGSLIPKDPLTQRNEAIDLWSAGAIDPLNFYKKLDFPDPVQATNQLILWQMLQKGQIQPQMYLPSFAVAGQQGLGQPAGVGGPAVNPPPNSPPPEGQQQTPASPEAIQGQSSALLGSVPIQ